MGSAREKILSPVRCWILYALSCGIRGYANIGEFVWADHLFLQEKSRQGIGMNVSAILNCMEKEGLVRYRYDAGTHSEHHILTPDGKSQLKAAKNCGFFSEDIRRRKHKLFSLISQKDVFENDYRQCLKALENIESGLSS